MKSDPAVVAIPFGKHKGQPLAAVPTSYLTWLVHSAKLSTGLAAAVREELERRGLTPPTPVPGRPHFCRNHPEAPVRAYWFTQRDGRRTIRGECSVCGQWVGTLPQTPEYVALADAGSDRAALLTFLMRLEEEGITATREGGRITYSPSGRMTRELWRMEKQCKQLLLSMLREGRP